MMLIGAIVLALLWFISSGYRKPLLSPYTSQLILQRGAGNVSKQSRKTL